ncbi:hypothetical protein [Microcoleus sp. Pol17_C1]|uniref:hypothetical protein n=1 Tax=unclassified Microcoleus TaxID=2642155 RepID=UPI002FD25657
MQVPLMMYSGLLGRTSIQEAYYKDADKIPKDVVDEVAAATKANIPFNYPDPRVLNQTELLSRGSATALIHQALVYQGPIEPLFNNEEATKYIPASPAKRNNLFLKQYQS